MCVYTKTKCFHTTKLDLNQYRNNVLLDII